MTNIIIQPIENILHYLSDSYFLCFMKESLHLASVGHDIVFGKAELILAEYFQRNPDKRPIVIADENTFKHCWPKVLGANDDLNAAEIIQLDSGEENKNIDVCVQVWEALLELKVSRNDVIINLGGGVITDLGGFIASTFKRGVSFIQVPTSLLAMVDASIGGKVGVDLAGLKNLIGNFAVPEMFVIDVDFLDSLPDVQLICGFAEVLKHGAILDNNYWMKATQNSVQELSHIKSLVARSVELKNEVVLADFEDKSERKKLNFGHTVGHALETHFLNTETPLLHGEAVAIGMIIESGLGYAQGITTHDCYKSVVSTILALYKVPEIGKEAHEPLLEIMRNDKKNQNGRINFTFVKDIGNSVIDQTAPESAIIEALSKIQELEFLS